MWTKLYPMYTASEIAMNGHMPAGPARRIVGITIDCSTKVPQMRFVLWGGSTGTYVPIPGGGSGDPPAGKSTDAYLLFDLSAKYKLTRWLEIYGNGRNLLDTAYVTSHRPYGARPGAPRWVSLGLRAEFH